MGCSNLLRDRKKSLDVYLNFKIYINLFNYSFIQNKKFKYFAISENCAFLYIHINALYNNKVQKWHTLKNVKYARTHTHTYIHTHTYTHTHAHIYTHTYTHTRTHTHIHIYIYTYIYIYIYIYYLSLSLSENPLKRAQRDQKKFNEGFDMSENICREPLCFYKGSYWYLLNG